MTRQHPRSHDPILMSSYRNPKSFGGGVAKTRFINEALIFEIFEINFKA